MAVENVDEVKIFKGVCERGEFMCLRVSRDHNSSTIVFDSDVEMTFSVLALFDIDQISFKCLLPVCSGVKEKIDWEILTPTGQSESILRHPSEGSG